MFTNLHWPVVSFPPFSVQYLLQVADESFVQYANVPKQSARDLIDIRISPERREEFHRVFEEWKERSDAKAAEEEEAMRLKQETVDSAAANGEPEVAADADADVPMSDVGDVEKIPPPAADEDVQMEDGEVEAYDVAHEAQPQQDEAQRAAEEEAEAKKRAKAERKAAKAARKAERERENGKPTALSQEELSKLAAALAVAKAKKEARSASKKDKASSKKKKWDEEAAPAEQEDEPMPGSTAGASPSPLVLPSSASMKKKKKSASSENPLTADEPALAAPAAASSSSALSTALVPAVVPAATFAITECKYCVTDGVSCSGQRPKCQRCKKKGIACDYVAPTPSPQPEEGEAEGEQQQMEIDDSAVAAPSPPDQEESTLSPGRMDLLSPPDSQVKLSRRASKARALSPMLAGSVSAALSLPLPMPVPASTPDPAHSLLPRPNQNAGEPAYSPTLDSTDSRLHPSVEASPTPAASTEASPLPPDLVSPTSIAGVGVLLRSPSSASLKERRKAAKQRKEAKQAQEREQAPAAVKEDANNESNPQRAPSQPIAALENRNSLGIEAPNHVGAALPVPSSAPVAAASSVIAFRPPAVGRTPVLEAMSLLIPATQSHTPVAQPPVRQAAAAHMEEFKTATAHASPAPVHHRSTFMTPTADAAAASSYRASFHELAQIEAAAAPSSSLLRLEFYPPLSNPTPFRSVSDLLAYLSMSAYLPLFEKEDLNIPRLLLLTETDLVQLLPTIGARKEMWAFIQRCNHQQKQEERLQQRHTPRSGTLSSRKRMREDIKKEAEAEHDEEQGEDEHDQQEQQINAEDVHASIDASQATQQHRPAATATSVPPSAPSTPLRAAAAAAASPGGLSKSAKKREKKKRKLLQQQQQTPTKHANGVNDMTD
jgi:hypothetical protein